MSNEMWMKSEKSGRMWAVILEEIGIMLHYIIVVSSIYMLW